MTQAVIPSGGSERDRVYVQLLDEIVENRLEPGTRLIEAQIAMRIGVSRTPVREALLRLEREGFAVSERHHGFRVAALDEKAAREIFPMFGALQALALPRAVPSRGRCRRAAARERAITPSCHKTPREALAADSAFHAILISLCPNARLLAQLHTLHHQLLRYEHMYMSDARLIETSLAQHEDIIENIERGDTSGAESAVRANYASGLAAVIAKIRQR